MSKKTLIEIIIAAVLVVTELILSFVFWFGGSVLDEYLHLCMAFILITFINIDLFFFIAIQVINSKGEKNNRIFEAFVAILLFVAEVFIALICRVGNEGWTVFLHWTIRTVQYYVRLLTIFVQMNIFYIIVLQIIHSEKYRLSKAVFAVLLPIVEFVTLWSYLSFSSDLGGNALTQGQIILFSVFANICVIFSIALKVFDSFIGKKVNKSTDNAPVSVQSPD